MFQQEKFGSIRNFSYFCIVLLTYVFALKQYKIDMIWLRGEVKILL